MSTITQTETYKTTPVRRRRGVRFWVLRGLLGIVVTLVALLTSGFVYQQVAEANDRRTFQPTGQMVDVNGQMMHLYCTGEGSPTIVLEAGAYNYSSEWYWVQQQLATTHRVCSYDRAGNGFSPPVEGARDGLTLTRELHGLVTTAAVPTPYVLVGHSLGGVLAPIYTAHYPDDVIGLVLVDPAVPLTWADESGYADYKAQNESAYFLVASLVRFGFMRLILPPELASYGYPDAVNAEMIALKSTAQAVDVWDAEVRLAQWDLGQQATRVNLEDMPIITLWAGHPEWITPEDRARLQAVWDMLPAYSQNMTTQVVEGANHGSIVGNEAYAQQVTAAVLSLITPTVNLSQTTQTRAG
jgi:pimeloyl-ACP methyl ester carboxylesterase